MDMVHDAKLNVEKKTHGQKDITHGVYKRGFFRLNLHCPCIAS